MLTPLRQIASSERTSPTNGEGCLAGPDGPRVLEFNGVDAPKRLVIHQQFWDEEWERYVRIRTGLMLVLASS